MNQDIKEIWLAAHNMEQPDFEAYIEKKYEIRYRDNEEIYKHEQGSTVEIRESCTTESNGLGDSKGHSEPDRYERMRFQERFLNDD